MVLDVAFGREVHDHQSVRASILLLCGQNKHLLYVLIPTLEVCATLSLGCFNAQSKNTRFTSASGKLVDGKRLSADSRPAASVFPHWRSTKI